MPDKVVFMEAPIEISMARTFDSTGDKFEKKGQAFYEKIIEGYHKASKLEMFTGKWGTIDAIGSPDEVFARILKFLGE